MKSNLSERKSVSLLNANRIKLRCENCSRAWSFTITKDKRLPRLFWICPDGCNLGQKIFPLLLPLERSSSRERPRKPTRSGK